MTAIVIAHKTADFNLNTADMTQAAILEAIKAAGYTLGAKSLSALMKGEKLEAGDFRVVVPAAPAPDAKKAAADAAKAAKAKADESKPHAKKGEAKADDKKSGDAPAAGNPEWPFQSEADKKAASKPAGKGKNKTLTPEQAALVKQANEEHGADAPKAARGTDWSNILPQSPVAVLKDSRNHKLFVFLCRPEGATKDEIMKEFNYQSAGTLGGILHWEPKSKGYFLNKMKRDDGKMAYFLSEINTGRRYTPEEIETTDTRLTRPEEMRKAIHGVLAQNKAVREAKDAAGMNEPTPAEAPKEKAAAPAPKAPVSVPKDAPIGAAPGTVTRRRNPKPQAAA